MQLYLVTNTIDGTMYVGKTVKTIATRWSEHKSHAKRGANTHLHRAIRKYGAQAFIVEPLVLLKEDFTDDVSLNDGERLMIRLLRKSSRLYNLTNGGDGTSGLVQSAEHRRKKNDAVSRAMTGRRKAYCKYGHPRTSDNVSDSGKCLACQKIHNVRYTHIRHHVNRGIVNPTCPLCRHER